MKRPTTPSIPSTGGVIAAFAAIYVIWGSTYLGIRYAVESIPPFLMAGTRNLVAGALLFAFARARGAGAPTRVQWRDAAIAGGLLLAIGNGGVTWAEQIIPSGVTALLVALVPFWMTLFDWLRPRGVRPPPRVAAGLAVGFAGVFLLAHHENNSAPAHGRGVIVLAVSSISWALGSIFSRHARKPLSPLLAVSMQMLAGGVLLMGMAVAAGEPARFSAGRVTMLSLGGWLYLVVAGSLVGYTCYAWLLHVSTPARVGTYAYVNPFIAVLLGCTIGHEALSHELFAAGVLILLAVVLIVRVGPSRQPIVASAPDEVE